MLPNLLISDFNYSLPNEKIAKFPVEPRDSSKLLVYQNGEISESVYSNLVELLPADSHLVFNQTKVVQARLKFQKNETTEIEIFCLEPIEGQDIQLAMQSSSPLEYKCLIGGARKWKGGFLEKNLKNGTELKVDKGERLDDAFLVKFDWSGSQTFAEILEEFGETPLPPYLERKAVEKDKKDYQTVFAKKDGSVAAPTAGLHFTEELLQKINNQKISSQRLSLHVGAGTFKPVSSENVLEHLMHAEEFFIDLKLVSGILENLGKAITPVGTTSMRALESLYWLGVKSLKGSDFLKDEKPTISQWEPYQNSPNISVKIALESLLTFLKKTKTGTLSAQTQILIGPGYSFKICKGLLTNFHQPKSTLLLLVAALVGSDWKRVYNYALENNFRFLSYGDACLFLPAL